MDREQVKGFAEKTKGAAKEGAGKVSGDKNVQNEGKADKAKGAADKAVGDVKHSAREAVESLKK